MSKSSKEAFRKLFDVEHNDEGKRTGRIRPRFSLFARSIIHNSNIGIYDIAADYLKHISKWDAIDKMKYVYDIFLKRPDFEPDESQKETCLNEKVSSFLRIIVVILKPSLKSTNCLCPISEMMKIAF